MAIIVENGTMPEGANVFASVAFADSYLGARGGGTTWSTAATEAKEAALVQATDYLNGMPWKGRKAVAGRVLAWPRVDATDADGYVIADNIVPEQVQAACVELALLAVQGKPLLSAIERGGKVKRKKVGPIETEFEDGAPAGTQYPAIDALLRGMVYGDCAVQLVRG